ncbi:MAG: NADH-quinone oxidoreductase subunit M [Bacteroidia bacterium]|nr:NADH-quinone oxidoreductase subunit M [Bacteroidia bacterium]
MTKEQLCLLMNLTVFAPAVGIPLLLMMKQSAAKYIALIASFIPFVLSLILLSGYLGISGTPEENGFILYSSFKWLNMPGMDINFTTGLDGISIHLLWLTTLIFPISIYFSWRSIDTYEKPYYALLLLLEVGVIGFFVSLDLLLFYVFFEMVLIPMYFIIGIWGGKDRIYASVKFFLYTLIGSLLMLIAIIYAGLHSNSDFVFTTDYHRILKAGFSPEVQTWLFLAFTLSFAIKVPMFPLHTWLPDAHVQAPTAGSVILAGVLLKMGTYGLVRFSLPLFPVAANQFADVMCILSVIGIIYGAMAAMVQTDIKKLVAYSSVSHMGFIVLGIFAFSKDAMSGAIIQMIGHGISTGALFLLVGMIYDRRHTREIKDYQGIAKQVPVFTLLFMITVFSSVGLPGLNGFIGEFLVLIGTGAQEGTRVYAFFAATGVIIAAVYLLWMFRRVMFGELDKEANKKLVDLNRHEVGLLMPLIALMFIMGLYATPFLKEINRSSDPLVQYVLEKNGLVLPTVAPAPQPGQPVPAGPQIQQIPVNPNQETGHEGHNH